MRCDDEARVLIHTELDGELTGAEVSELDAHCLECEECADLRRALSTRILRIASAAAAKKWPRLFQCRAFSLSTRCK